MQGISKETFLKAEDSKNRDAMLYDMLKGITEKIEECNKIKDDVMGFKTQLSLLKRLSREC